MVRVFRNIRQKFASENNVAKYFRYAIGEILLVVIGILIALQINNWNSTRIEKNKESVYLNNIIRDFNEQVIDIDAQIEFENTQLTNAKELLNAFEKKLPVDPSLLEKIIALTTRRTFVPVDATFQDLKSTGNLNLIRSNELRDKLINYYQSVTYEASIIGKNNTFFVDELFAKNIMEKSFGNFTRLSNDNNRIGFDFEIFEVSQNLKQEIDEVIVKNLMNNKSRVFIINLLSDRYFVSSVHKDRMEKLKIKTLKLVELVKRELN